MDEDNSHSAAMHSAGSPRRLIFRLIVGLIQGFALAFLIDAMRAHHWPAQNAQILAPAFLLAAFWPLLLSVSANIKLPVLLAWAAGSAALLIGLAEYDARLATRPTTCQAAS